jgi:hypothetical protein
VPDLPTPAVPTPTPPTPTLPAVGDLVPGVTCGILGKPACPN